MKQLFYLLMIFCMCFSTSAEAQILKKFSKRAEKAAERAVLKRTDEQVTKETNQALDTLFNEKGQAPSNGGAVNSNPANENAANPAVAETPGGKKATPWSKFNFVPGDEIIFEDDLAREENGEFPSRWDLLKGSAENASLDGQPVILFEKNAIIAPLMKEPKYLPEVFTIEFDAYFNDNVVSWQQYNVRFYQGSNGSAKINQDILHPLLIRANGAYIKVIEGPNRNDKTYDNFGGDKAEGLPGWKHIAISYNQRALKVFIDEERILNIPNIELYPEMVSIEAHTYKDETEVRAIKNVRIAKGGKDLYDRVMADGKFVTRGILFDVNQASLKPESMGVLNEVAKMMKEHPEIKFSIEGHTDSDGDNNYNLQLSEQRARAVREALASLGIDAARMQVKGLGETVPVGDNNSPEGKANNRRVEFVKI
ncbi:MAG TPA: OmpA family protein [Salinimicrobium catena]|uniref:OmpA family protein n=1 Tax=Salinimicrobium catena TaxID=390640 RepID=A0A7C2M471_9FLAO|nr:OmpA family protein [Salinimicrobium catena]